METPKATKKLRRQPSRNTGSCPSFAMNQSLLSSSLQQVMFVHIVLDFLTKRENSFLNLTIFLGLPKEFFSLSLGEKNNITRVL